MKHSHSIEAQIARLMWAFGVRTQVELAEALGIRQPTVSEGIKKGVIPAHWLLNAVENAGIRPHWIRTGEGPVTYCDGEDSLMEWAKVEPFQNGTLLLHGISTADLVEELRRRRAEIP